ncbi:S8 family serine peptidase [Dermatophilus congolensis]|uniref:S8 family serine peptidase n=1 Tax=Dermatophilus congolensis TaxID=1863 RepID=UPI001AAFB4CF|nr:S8 family serine peptidase [Dermatophilus congolensis]MBO3142483.1 S8 family serine peptidase [Dermatophilus congolensis]MBO3151472.1 S8 family serine peptidase [Dermatophilus congolensis]MBO3161524.1 S8 family serine peptidase [Dermatophilus congolensis]MBO3162758.1 S8 family serine peptidase [Dermatophilus congolensis]MBO3176312.1 S8 family serine peptidase [Dermatophilus congolensis]
MRARTSRIGNVATLALALTLGGATAIPASAEPLPPASTTGEVSDGAKGAPDKEKMSSHSQELLVEAEAAGKSRVTVMAATERGKTAEVVKHLTSLGATIGYVHDKLGYVRASVPTSKAEHISTIPQVKYVDLDEIVSEPKPDPTPGTSTGSSPWTGPSPQTPAENPYLPTADTGAVAFTKKNPTYDGRGITIGVLDSGVDLEHPALATTTTGERKISNWITATDPLLESDPTWRVMLNRVSGETATFRGTSWKLPHRDDAQYSIDIFRESSSAESEFKGDIDRNGKTDDSWGILYDYRTHDIWVDTDGDHDFTNNTPMRPYAEKNQVGHFGKDNPSTRVQENVPFVVEYRTNVDLTPIGHAGTTADVINIGTVASAHGTHVAGIAAANMPGWKMQGAAPGAKIVSAKACVYAGGCTSVALTEGMIELVANQRVDIVNMSIGGLPALNDGNNTRSALYNRIIDEYGVQIFISAGNSGAGTNTIGDPSVATDAVSVAAGASKETWLANYGAKAKEEYWAQNYSSRGPREDGGFKPNIMAPGSAISAVPMFMDPEDIPQVSYKLPVGLSMFNGTSMASPQATGAAALLLSAARQNDLPITPAQLRASLESTTRFIPGLEPTAQGNGLIRIDRAWPILRKAPEASNKYAISAPVCTPLAHLLATPNKGEGIYNRCDATKGGHKTGQRRTYNVTITRTAGPQEATSHTLTWIGNDGTYSSTNAVELPLGKPVTIPVIATPKTLGTHAAILDITPRDNTIRGTRMMADIITSNALDAAPYTASMAGNIDRVRARSIFVTVPEKTQALQVNLAGIAHGSAVRFLAIDPLGMPVESEKIQNRCYTSIGDAKVCPPTSRAYTNPRPGVWEIVVDASRRTPVTSNPFRLTASAQGVTVDPAEKTIPTASVGSPTEINWNIKNDFGSTPVRGTGGPLGSAHEERPSISQGEKHTYKVAVPAGTNRLEISTGKPADINSDLDIVVRDASGTEVGRATTSSAEETVTLAHPTAGTYTVEIDGYTIPSGKMAYDYQDVYYSSTLGKLTINNGPLHALEHGATLPITGEITPNTQPGEGRHMFGELTIMNSENAAIGFAKVSIEKITTK